MELNTVVSALNILTSPFSCLSPLQHPWTMASSGLYVNGLTAYPCVCSPEATHASYLHPPTQARSKLTSPWWDISG